MLESNPLKSRIFVRRLAVATYRIVAYSRKIQIFEHNDHFGQMVLAILVASRQRLQEKQINMYTRMQTYHLNNGDRHNMYILVCSVHMHVYSVYIHVYGYMYMDICMYICICICIWNNIYIYIYINIYIYIHETNRERERERRALIYVDLCTTYYIYIYIHTTCVYTYRIHEGPWSGCTDWVNRPYIVIGLPRRGARTAVHGRTN